jgi:regulator of protease activity HflC (stomatin/prohibitin superfamily)
MKRSKRLTRSRSDLFRLAFAFALVLGVPALSGCTVIRQGEVGVKRTWGKLNPNPLPPGLAFYEAVSTDIIKVPTQSVNKMVTLSLPSKEGVNVEAQISILYRIDATKAPRIIETIGETYEETVILPVFRSAAADVCARFPAKDLYSGERSTIEREIVAAMGVLVRERGFIIEAVLMKSIQLPASLARAIEEKLASEQEAQRMQFVLQRERSEAERRRIEAEGIRDAQKTIGDGLNSALIQWKAIEAFRSLAGSPNTKIIITDGRSPLLVSPEAKQ